MKRIALLLAALLMFSLTGCGSSEAAGEASDSVLHRQNLPTKVRQRTKKDGGEELVLYVKQADRDYARYCTGWRPGM